jgi:plastocyanin
VATRQTTSAGEASFPSVAAGTYAVEIDVPAGLELGTGQAARRNVTVAGGGSAEVAFALVEAEDPPGSVVEIHLTSGSRFDPSSVTISVGTTVRWISDTSTFHTITPRNHSEWSRVEMDAQGKTFEHTFNNAGTFDYFCEPHESAGMTGSITVQ